MLISMMNGELFVHVARRLLSLIKFEALHRFHVYDAIIFRQPVQHFNVVPAIYFTNMAHIQLFL